MSKQRYVLDPNPDNWWWIFWLHVPEGEDRPFAYHKVWVWDPFHYPHVADGCFVCPSEANAWGTAFLWRSLPDVLQDMCFYCYPSIRPGMPRYNIYRGEEPVPVLPVCIEYWDWWP